MDVITSMCDVHPKWRPRGRWLDFEDAAAAGGGGAWCQVLVVQAAGWRLRLRLARLRSNGSY
jgi:hypothetical protein